MARTALQRRRVLFQVGFFALFVLAPVLDIFRVDLTRGHAILIGQDRTLGFAFLWALVLLTYLLPPAAIYHNLVSGELTRNQTIFLAAGTTALSVVTGRPAPVEVGASCQPKALHMGKATDRQTLADVSPGHPPASSARINGRRPWPDDQTAAARGA
jgi:hypothetical protein